MIPHRFSGNGKLVLFDQSGDAAGIEKATKRMELTAEGNHVVMLLTVNKGESSEKTLDVAGKEVKMSMEDLFSLIEAYIEIAY